MILARASIKNSNCNHSFILLATVIMIVNYNLKTFTALATGPNVINLGTSVIYKFCAKLEFLLD